MIEYDPAVLEGDDSWRLVLGAYQSGQSQLKAQDPESDGWLPRLRTIEGIEGEALSRVHGRLIALGFLKFELLSREVGMRYQVSPLGKRTLEQGSYATEDPENSVSEHEPDQLSGAA